MTSESYKALCKKAIQIWSTGNLSQLYEVYAPNCINHQRHHIHNDETLKGIDSLRELIQEFRGAFPDFYDIIEDQIAEGNKVVTRFTSQGTQRGEWMGIPPTNKKICLSGVIIDRIEDGKIVESWVNWDLQGLLDQLGVAEIAGRR